MCIYNKLGLVDGRVRRQARKKFLADRLALAPPSVAANKRRVSAGRARRGWLGRGRFRGPLGEARGMGGRGGAGLAASGSAGRSGRRAARARAARRVRSPGPTRSWLGRPWRCGCGARARAPPASGPLAARWICRLRHRLSTCRPGRQRVTCAGDERETMHPSAERMPPGCRGPRRGRAASARQPPAAPRRRVRDLRP